MCDLGVALGLASLALELAFVSVGLAVRAADWVVLEGAHQRAGLLDSDAGTLVLNSDIGLGPVIMNNIYSLTKCIYI